MPYPNPAYGPPLTVEIDSPGDAVVRWAVFTTAFRKIRSGSLHMNGSGSFQWDLTDGTGAPVAKGIYYLRMEAEDGRTSVKRIFKILVL